MLCQNLFIYLFYVIYRLRVRISVQRQRPFTFVVISVKLVEYLVNLLQNILD